MREEDFGENCVARIASPCPGIVEAHLETACTLKTAWGAAEIFWTSSVLMRPGFIRAFQIFVGKAVVIGSVLVLIGTGSVNRYGIYSEES
jgi:hypothetical protein